MKKNTKLIISDLDGTLLNNKSELSKETIRVVKELIKQGHLFCISTGRPIRSVMKFYKQLGLNTIVGTLNGCNITNPTDSNFLQINLTFSKEILKKIVNNKNIISKFNYMIIENFDSTFILEGNEKVDFSNEINKSFHITKDTSQIIKNSNINKIKKDINSILIWTKQKHVDQIAFEIKSILVTLVVRTWKISKDSDDVVIEINSRSSDKGTFLKFASSYYGIPYEDIYVFGDSDNDVSMIEKIQNAYAMKNSNDLVKLISYKMTDKTNDEDGVVDTLKKEFNIK